MTERWEQVRAVFSGAFGLDGAEREAFLADACGEDDDLRREVKELLESASSDEGFLEPPAEPESASRWIGRRVASYQIHAVIASGGMGVVFEAEREQPKQRVALKMMKSGFDSQAAARRFGYESDILGRLRHPGIAQVYEAGIHREDDALGVRELPWFAMELVEDSRSLLEHATARELSLPERLALFASVCDAVHHGHQRGVVHRDLKPDNILVDGHGRPKVIDFGVARATDADGALHTRMTQAGTIIGTLHYMSPEQLVGDSDAVDASSDVYGLGVVLYELVCGRLPYDFGDAPIHEVARIIREVPPRRPQDVDRALTGDVDVILSKAIEKDPGRRYASASALAADLTRCVRHEPIEARPTTTLYRLRLLVTRNPVATGAVALAVAALVLGAVASAIFGFSERRAARDAARQARVAEEVNAFVNRDLLGAVDPMLGADPDLRVRDVLVTAAERIEGRFPDEPLVEAGVRASIGRGFYSIGLPSEARPHLERAVQILTRERGVGDRQTVEARVVLAGCYVRLGDRSAADGLTTALLDELPDGSSRARVLAARGALLSARGQFEESLRACRAGLTMLDLDGPHGRVSFTLESGVADTLRRLGRMAEAEDAHRKVLERAELTLGPDHPRSLSVRANFALLLQDKGLRDEARSLLEECLAGSLEVFGPRHYQTLIIRRNLAIVFLQLRRVDEAEEQIEVAVEGIVELLGEEHPETLATKMVLATVRLAQRRPTDAEPLLRSVVEGASQAGRANRALAGEATLHLSRTLTARGATDEAIALLEVAVAVPPGEETEVTLALGNQLGTLLRRAGHLERAEPVLARVASQMRARMGTHMGTAVSLRNHGLCLRDLERTDEAREALEQAHGMLVELAGEESPMARTVAGEMEALGGG